ncbi:MAG: DUF4974 domain-containing protein [Bacteroidales bacterium]|nr:DUF4974 domain-containing protein [Bacteroidales bacterium]
MDKKILEKFLSNECSIDELRIVAEWLSKEGSGLNGWIWLKKYWNCIDSSGDIPELAEMGLLDKTHHALNLKMNSATGRNRPREKSLIPIGRFITRAAAILFLPLLLTSLLYYNHTQRKTEPVPQAITQQNPIYQQITSPMGSKTRLELSDGSVVWLNHGSSLRFPLAFTGKERTVYLEGEAYFDVDADMYRPFIVRAGDMQFRATGTSFNIMAYPEENLVELTLEEGKVKLQKILSDRTLKNFLELDPGQQARYYPEKNRIDFEDVDPANYVSWKDGKLVMINDPLSRIARKLERWYNVEIDFTSEEMGYIRYSGTFTDETLSQVLNLMELATPIDYTIYPRERKPDGTYMLPRVLIGLKKGYQLHITNKITSE